MTTLRLSWDTVTAGIAPPQSCNGLMLPIVVFDQMYSFDVDTLIKSIPTPEGQEEAKFRPIAEEIVWRIIQLADNAGATDEHRALNYLAVRYDAIYAKAADCYRRTAEGGSPGLSSERVSVGEDSVMP